MIEINLTLPMPISVNMAYSGLGRRYKSAKYKEWVKAAKDTPNKQYTVSGGEWLEVSYTFYTPLFYKNGKKKILDVFNYEKVLSDFIAKESTVDGFEDHLILKGNVEKIDSPRNEVEVLIREISIDHLAHQK